MLKSGRIVELSHRMVPGEEEFPLEIETFNTDEAIMKADSSILFISSKIEKLIWMSDRNLVISGSRITRDVMKTKFDQDCILELALQGAG